MIKKLEVVWSNGTHYQRGDLISTNSLLRGAADEDVR